MKKIIILCSFMALFSIILTLPTKAESVMEPQWGEFCPPLYENAVFKQDEKNSSKYKENNYWALRRVKFQKSIAECKVIAKNSDELNACFARVANIEKNKTNQRKEAKYERNSDQDREIRDGGYWWY